ncbi:MAG: lysylphosphatidylglycerol synthase transmembrane domain-containing protein [Candidatus Woesearchaeota archaeon]|nr:lysylphosphatidylglycerol synthase transmembrane domain-containing protein [Candidatus Woesearchaeota archaeon]
MKKLFLYLKILLSALILIFLFNKVGFKNIYTNLINFNILYLIPIIIIVALIFILTNININLLLGPLKKRIKFLTLLKYNGLVYAFSCFFPGRTGDLSMIYFLRKENIELGEGTVVFLLDRIISFTITSILAIIGFFVFLPPSKGIYAILTLASLLAIGFFLLFNKTGNLLLKKFILRKMSERFKGFRSTYSQFIRYHKKILLLNMTLTFLKIILDSTVIFVLFSSFNTYIPITYIIIIRCMITLATLIPITVNGLGIRESLSVFFYSLLGINSVTVVSVYTLLIIIRYSIALFFILLFFNKKLKMSSMMSQSLKNT